MAKWSIKIIERNTNKPVKEMTAPNQRTADRIARGASINLDHVNYYVDTVKLPTE